MTSKTCLFCGEEELVELFEIWSPGHEFMLETCCEDLHQVVCEEMARDPEYARDLLRELGVEDFVGHELRRVADNDGQMLLDYSLEVREIARDDARAFVTAHHQHNKAPVGWRYGAAIYNAGALVGVVMVGRPVARMIDASRVVEVNRLCVDLSLPHPLRWNACSQLYGWAAREAKRRGFERIITYTLETEPATALKASGWTAAAKTKGGTWNRPSRDRQDTAPTVRKIRWERELREAA